MKRYTPPDQARRDFLKQAVPAAAGVVAVPVLALTATEAFAGKTSKSAVQYQNKPKDDQKCSQCVFFIAAKSGGKGKCQVGQGDISPQGWCSLYQA
jgi:hypothetical protein